ncbi:MAG: type II toxin-antitoxin system BrnA family antitoxin [Allorhizobium sp.]
MTKMTAEEFDRKFDNGENIDDDLDWSQAKTGDIGRNLFLVKLGEESATEIAAEARRLGVSVDELISRWVDERLKEERRSAAE